jgi:hypothetical protein
VQNRLRGRRLAAPPAIGAAAPVTATVRDVAIEHQPPDLQANLTGLARHHRDDVSRHFRSPLDDD